MNKREKISRQQRHNSAGMERLLSEGGRGERMTFIHGRRDILKGAGAMKS